MQFTQANVRLGEGVYIAPTAYVGGDLRIGDHSTIMHHVTIRADIAPIRLGEAVNVQDGSVLHTRYAVPLDIEDHVAIGHRAVVHCRRVGSGSLIGTGAIVLDDAVIEPGALVAAGTLVPPGMRVPAGTVVMGVPARAARQVSDAERAMIHRIVQSYIETGRKHADGEFPNIACEYR